jgi:enolase-phosphatase E1
VEGACPGPVRLFVRLGAALLFGNSEAGDLTPLFSGYFDTEIGAKRDPEAYRHILSAINLRGDGVLFLSDIVAELDAARAAGMRTTLLARPPSDCPADSVHPCVSTFAAIRLD